MDFHAPWTLKNPSDLTLTAEGMTSGIYMLIASLFYVVLTGRLLPARTRCGSYILANNPKVVCLFHAWVYPDGWSLKHFKALQIIQGALLVTGSCTKLAF